MKLWHHLLLVVMLTLATSALARPACAGDLYQGRVIDEETGQPLAGAVLAVVWFRSAIVSLEVVRHFQSVQKAVTDSDGKFALIVSPGIDWSPFTYVRKEPKIVFFYPGYEPTWEGWLKRNKLKSELEFAEELKKGASVKLQKLKSQESLRYFSSLGAVAGWVVPASSVPNLLRVVNTRRKMAGITSLYPEPAQEGKNQ